MNHLLTLLTGLPTPYALVGDPLSGEGWVDGDQFGPGDRRVGLASGPFNMAVGDTQEVVVAEIAAIGLNRLQAYRILKYYDVLAQEAFDNGLEINSSILQERKSRILAVIGTTWKIKSKLGIRYCLRFVNRKLQSGWIRISRIQCLSTSQSIPY